MIPAAAPAEPLARGPGRPREFDVDDALDKAVRVFCERGYHATSIGDLMDAMQLASGSVYKAFKNKRAVFLAAFDRYKIIRDGHLQEAIATGKTGRERIRKALCFFVKASYGAEGRQGCLITGTAAELAIFDDEVALRVKAALEKSERLMADLIRQGQTDGSIAAHIDGAATARLILCVLQGMRVVGKTGRSRAEMTAMVDIAMKVLG
jgi:TetR/AcrR family transcriptional regulator, transcriptional repressor for nem operon